MGRKTEVDCEVELVCVCVESVLSQLQQLAQCTTTAKKHMVESLHAFSANKLVSPSYPAVHLGLIIAYTTHTRSLLPSDRDIRRREQKRKKREKVRPNHTVYTHQQIREWKAAGQRAETCKGTHLQCLFLSEVSILGNGVSSVSKWSLWFYHGNLSEQNRHPDWHFFPSCSKMLLEEKTAKCRFRC